MPYMNVYRPPIYSNMQKYPKIYPFPLLSRHHYSVVHADLAFPPLPLTRKKRNRTKKEQLIFQIRTRVLYFLPTTQKK